MTAMYFYLPEAFALPARVCNDVVMFVTLTSQFFCEHATLLENG